MSHHFLLCSWRTRVKPAGELFTWTHKAETPVAVVFLERQSYLSIVLGHHFVVLVLCGNVSTLHHCNWVTECVRMHVCVSVYPLLCFLLHSILCLSVTTCALSPTLQLHSPSLLLRPPPPHTVTPSETQGGLGWADRWRGLYLEAHLPLASKKLSASRELRVCLSESPVNPHYPLQHCTGGLAEYK